MKQTIFQAGRMLLAMTLLCGVLYTLALTGVGQLCFPFQANGSVIEVDGKTYGSALLGQPFSDPGHLWGRVMEADVNTFADETGKPVLYAWPTNQSPASEAYAAQVAERVQALHRADPAMDGTPIPADLVTCSGSGLDPAISPAAAAYQVHRIAAARGIAEDEVRAAIRKATTGRLFGVFGEPAVNVLRVNLILDGIGAPE